MYFNAVPKLADRHVAMSMVGLRVGGGRGLVSWGMGSSPKLHIYVSITRRFSKVRSIGSYVTLYKYRYRGYNFGTDRPQTMIKSTDIYTYTFLFIFFKTDWPT